MKALVCPFKKERTCTTPARTASTWGRSRWRWRGRRPAGRGGPPRPGSGSAGWSCSSSGACGTPAPRDAWHVTPVTTLTTLMTRTLPTRPTAMITPKATGTMYWVSRNTTSWLTYEEWFIVTTAHSRYMTAIMTVFPRLLGCVWEGRGATRSRVGVPSSSVSPGPPRCSSPLGLRLSAVARRRVAMSRNKFY